MAVDVTKVITALNAKTAGANHWMAKCPCHNDEKASLSISLKDGKILMKCMTRCATADILGAAGLSWSDLGEPKHTKLTAWEKIENWAKEAFGGSAFIKDKYPYIDEDGTYLYTKVRFEGCPGGKEIRYFTIDKDNDKFSFSKSEDRKKILYRLPQVIKAVEEGFPINIVEGEKDVHSLEKFHWTATTAGGVNDWSSEYSKYFKGADVRIFPDNDEAGEDLANRIARDLKNYAYRIRIVKTSTQPKGDVSDYLNDGGHNKETLNALINESEAMYSPWVEVSKNSESINVDRLSRIFNKNEHYLIARDKNGNGTRLYLYEDGVYVPASAEMIKCEIYKYYGCGKATTSSADNVFKLLMCRGDHFCSADEINMDENIINLQNGILNLKTMKLEPHSPKHLSTCRLLLNYDENCKSMPVFVNYMNTFCKGDDGIVDKQKRMVIQEVMGLILSNVHGYRPKKAAFLYSIIGNTGKTQLVNLITEMLGRDRCITVQLQAMNSNNRFALSSLPSARMVGCGDQTGTDVLESSIFKRLTGGDSVTVEKKGSDPLDFHYKGFLLYACNALPNFKDDKGDQLFDRLLIVPCCHTVPEADRDRNLLDKMLKEKSAIFNWALVGLQRLIANNYAFTKCDAIDDAGQTFRNRIDSVSRFLDVNGYVVTGKSSDRVNAKELFDEYKKWCADEENEITHRIEKSSSFADRMEGHEGIKKKKTGGNYCFVGLSHGFYNAGDSEGNPFSP